jgi:hypothetical protein
MSITREDLLDPNIDDEERAIRQSLFDRFMSCDKWCNRALGNTAVLLTSHPGNRAYLKASLESHAKLGFWNVVSYDNYFAPDSPSITPDMVMPGRDVIDMIDTFVMPHHQTWGGVLYPYFWLLKFGLAAVSQFEYVFCSNGDCVLEKPENFPQIIEMLGDGDIIFCGWEESGAAKIANSTSFLAKTSAAIAMMKHVQDNFVPYDNYERTLKENWGNCEARMGRAIVELGLKNVIVPENPYNTQLHKKGYGTWYKILGFRHIHGEHGYAYRYKGIPPEIEYLDPRYSSGEYYTIKKYWETKDMKLIEDWWAK